MNPRTLLLVILVVLAPPAMAQVADEGGSFQPADNGSSTGDNRAICGDGSCESFEPGICPEDCGGPGLASGEGGDGNPSVESWNSTMLLLGGLIFVIITGIIAALLVLRSKGGESRSGDRSPVSNGGERGPESL